MTEEERKPYKYHEWLASILKQDAEEFDMLCNKINWLMDDAKEYMLQAKNTRKELRKLSNKVKEEIVKLEGSI